MSARARMAAGSAGRVEPSPAPPARGRWRAWLAGLLVSACLAGAAGAQPPGHAQIDAFLAALEGAWQGEALVTPLGLRPYDIVFARNAEGELAGAADPGGAIHHWTFRREGQGLELRFLSTFRGNRTPILLSAAALEDEAFVFRALWPDFLSIRIRAARKAVSIRVFHGERLHVDIRLRRD